MPAYEIELNLLAVSASESRQGANLRATTQE
ncbi:hypothetical protein AB7M23_001275 [Pseudomonas sp. HLS-6 TE3448]|jgi:hypothetical protein